MRQGRSIAAFGMVSLVVAASAGAQVPPPAQANPAPAQPQLTDVSTRFRFVERYVAEGPKSRPEVIGQYRVAVRETIKQVMERPKGTPVRTENSVQLNFTERPALVVSNNVTDVVRRYDGFRLLPDRVKPSESRPLEGLTIWSHQHPSGNPLVMGLTEGRVLHEIEYGVACRQIFLPDLKGLLPALPSRIGDVWKVPQSAAKALLGDRRLGGAGLTGKLTEVRKPEKGSRWVAVVSLSGHVSMTMAGDTATNAQYLFSFTPPDAPPSVAAVPGPKPVEEGTVEAWGAITEIRMALTSIAPLTTEPNERLRRITTREVILQRQLVEGKDLLPIPAPPPKPTEANSWLTYDDPQGRFFLRHPQELQPPPADQRDPDGISFASDRTNGNDVVAFEILPKTGKSAEDRLLRDPLHHVKELKAGWARNNQEVIQLPDAIGWLPDAEWSPYKMRVHRFQAALKTTGKEARTVPRIYLDHYFIQFTKDECMIVQAMTSQDPPTKFRKQAEAIIKTFKLGESRNEKK